MYLLRWMLQKDLEQVLPIERESFEFPWTKTDFIHCLRRRNSIGIVLEHVASGSTDGSTTAEILAYTVYDLHKTQIHILNFAVDPHFRRTGIGSALIEKFKAKLDGRRRTRLLVEISENNLAGQLFFRSQGFRCVSVLRHFYEEFGEDYPDDAYVMEHTIPSRPIDPQTALFRNERFAR